MADINRQQQQGSQQGDFHFRCADVGDKNCKWEARGNSEEDVLRQAEQHGREAHNLKMDDNLRQKVRGAIRRAA